MTKHATERLQTRVQPQHIGIASRLLASASRYNDAALTTPVNRGLNLVVIVRHGDVITLFYREVSRVTAAKLNVSQVVTL